MNRHRAAYGQHDQPDTVPVGTFFCLTCNATLAGPTNLKVCPSCHSAIKWMPRPGKPKMIQLELPGMPPEIV